MSRRRRTAWFASSTTTSAQRTSAPAATAVPRGTPYPGYFMVAEIEAEMAALVAAHPGLARVIDLSTLNVPSRIHAEGRIIEVKRARA